MKRILVLCTGNSCRSQMAEGYLRQFAGSSAEVYSAGLETHGLNPYAVSIMKEDGIDISHHTSNSAEEYKHMDFDFIITVCDHASEHCPYFPGRALRFHQGFPDPAKVKGGLAEIEAEFRKVRNLVRTYFSAFVLKHLNK
jgi:arsenate reductase